MNHSSKHDYGSHTRSGASYFLQGFSLIKTKGLKRFVLIPLFVNVVLFAMAFYFLIDVIQQSIEYVIGFIPDWEWLKNVLMFVLWPIAVVSVLLVFSLLFGTLANWIAAPFNGLLSEKVERHLKGESLGNDTLIDVIKDTPRVFSREFQKLVYYIPRAIGFFILFMIIPVVGQIIWFLFTAWMMSIQYLDYCFDNHKLAFTHTRLALASDKSKAFSFGVTTSLFAFVPLINFIVMPVAVCGATAMYVDRAYEQKAFSTNNL